MNLASVYFTFFIDNLAWAIVFPIFAPYFLNTSTNLFSAEITLATRTTILGFFLTAFSLGQFVGAPILGEYADRHGRRKALLLSIFCTFIGLLLSAWSMEKNQLWLLFIGRLITGVFAGSMSICLACVTDLSETGHQKARRFGSLSLIAGLSFILGAFFGGKLADPTLDQTFSPNFPLWLAAFLTFCNFLFVAFGFRETAHGVNGKKFDFLECFHNLKGALKGTEKIKRIYTIYFLFLFAWTMLFQFSPVLVVREFNFTSSNIGDLALFMGICWAIGSGYLSKMLQRHFPPLRILEVTLLTFSCLSFLLIFPTHIYTVLATLALCVMIGGLAWPLCTAVISDAAPSTSQGKILGMSQAVQSLAMTLAPAFGGIAYQGAAGFPFLLGALATLGAGAVYFTLKDR